MVMVNFDRLVEYDGTDTRSMMMYHVTNEDAGLSASMAMIRLHLLLQRGSIHGLTK